MVSKGQFVGLDWNRITRLHSQVMIGTQEVKNSLTASRCRINIEKLPVQKKKQKQKQNKRDALAYFF